MNFISFLGCLLLVAVRSYNFYDFKGKGFDEWQKDGWWSIGPDSFIEQEIVLLRKIQNINVNSCYELKFGSKLRIFCYPRIMITGFPKCATSALFDLIASHHQVQVTGARGKENCHRFVKAVNMSKWWFLKSLKKYYSVHKNKVLVDGCIFADFNMQVRDESEYVSLYISFPFLSDSRLVAWAKYDLRGYC